MNDALALNLIADLRVYVCNSRLTGAISAYQITSQLLARGVAADQRQIALAIVTISNVEHYTNGPRPFSDARLTLLVRAIEYFKWEPIWSAPQIYDHLVHRDLPELEGQIDLADVPLWKRLYRNDEDRQSSSSRPSLSWSSLSSSPMLMSMSPSTDRRRRSSRDSARSSSPPSDSSDGEAVARPPPSQTSPGFSPPMTCEVVQAVASAPERFPNIDSKVIFENARGNGHRCTPEQFRILAAVMKSPNTLPPIPRHVDFWKCLTAYIRVEELRRLSSSQSFWDIYNQLVREGFGDTVNAPLVQTWCRRSLLPLPPIGILPRQALVAPSDRFWLASPL